MRITATDGKRNAQPVAYPPVDIAGKSSKSAG
jgi:hypothetical protein